MESDSPKLKIMTYDDLLANATAAFENIIGAFWDPGPDAARQEYKDEPFWLFILRMAGYLALALSASHFMGLGE